MGDGSMWCHDESIWCSYCIRATGHDGKHRDGQHRHWEQTMEQYTPAPRLIKEADPELERLLAEEEEIDRKIHADAQREEMLRVHTWFDDDNNFKPPEGVWDDPEGVVTATKVNRLRLSVAAELMRNKTYGQSGIDAAIDDADSALGFLFRTGILGTLTLEDW